MGNKTIQKFKKPGKRPIIKRLMPRRKPSRLKGKVQNVGIKPVQKKKKR
ncbi:hypothetical protein LCGC14_0102770 [marine sediment metagenome]|uniref:Uncharacterized protein n=1 Tax=marine sediment metagenome TaxID=412755 RepID=A0A0F9XTQ9_9ZZZZ